MIIILVLFFFFPIIFAPLILLLFLIDRSFKRKKIYAILLVIFVSILLFYFEPDESKDLFRYYIIMNKLSIMNFNEFMIYLSSRVEPLANTYFYIFSKFGNNHFVIVSTTFISYHILNYVLFDHQKEKKINHQDFNMVFLFMISTFYLVDDITGIRFCIARLILYLALYLDFFKGDRSLKVKLLYIIAPLIHTSCIIFLAIRVMMKFINNKFNIKIFACLALLSFSPKLIIEFTKYLSVIPVFSSISMKAEEYLNLNAGFYPMFILQVIIMLFLLIVLNYVKKHYKSANNSYINYVLMVLSIGLVFVQCTSISTRFIRSAIVFALPILMDYLYELKQRDKLVIYVIFFVICGLSLGFQISHLTVKIHYGSLFEDGIFKNILSLFF